MVHNVGVSLQFQVDDWYDIHDGFQLELKPGFTALVGPNGAGKTTLLEYIRGYAERHHIHFWEYSNLIEGGKNARDNYVFSGNIARAASSAMSSEGENVAADFGARVSKLGKAVAEAKAGNYPLIVLLDAIDSGASIDRARDLRALFDLIDRNDISQGAEVYLIMAVNHYELAKAPADCVHVRTGQHLTFQSYDEYADFICTFAGKMQKRR